MLLYVQKFSTVIELLVIILIVPNPVWSFSRFPFGALDFIFKDFCRFSAKFNLIFVSEVCDESEILRTEDKTSVTTITPTYVKFQSILLFKTNFYSINESNNLCNMKLTPSRKKTTNYIKQKI